MNLELLAMNAQLEALRLCQAGNVAGIANALKWDVNTMEQAVGYIHQLSASIRAGMQVQQPAVDPPPEDPPKDE